MRREKIIEVAILKFSQKGYHATLSEIAEASGIKKQSIYNYFKHKEVLFLEIIEKEVKSFYSEMAYVFQNTAGKPLEERLKTIYFSIIEYYKDISKLRFWRWILLIESKELFDKCREIMRTYEYIFAQSLQDAIDEAFGTEMKERNYARLQSFFVMLHGTLDGQLLYHDLYDVMNLANNVWRIYWTGVSSVNEQ